MKIFRKIVALNLFLVISFISVASATAWNVKCINSDAEASRLSEMVSNELSKESNDLRSMNLVALYFGNNRDIVGAAQDADADNVSVSVFWIKDPSILPEKFRKEFYRSDYPFVVLSSETKAPAVWMSSRHAEFTDQVWAAYTRAFLDPSEVKYVPNLPRKRPCLCGEHE